MPLVLGHELRLERAFAVPRHVDLDFSAVRTLPTRRRDAREVGVVGLCRALETSSSPNDSRRADTPWGGLTRQRTRFSDARPRGRIFAHNAPVLCRCGTRAERPARPLVTRSRSLPSERAAFTRHHWVTFCSSAAVKRDLRRVREGYAQFFARANGFDQAMSPQARHVVRDRRGVQFR